MNQQFYIAVNGQQTGPFSYDDLKTKDIRRDTLVWTEGLDSWTKAEFVSLLKDILRATPPPIPNEENKQQITPPRVPEQVTEKYFGYTLASRWDRLFATILEAIIILVPFVSIFGIDILEEDNTNSFSSVIGGTIFAVILGAIFYSMWSGNLGHKVLGLKVISSIDGSDQKKASTGALREGLKNIFSFIIIPVIWLLWDEDNQNLYDKISKTYVVKKNKT